MKRRALILVFYFLWLGLSSRSMAGHAGTSAQTTEHLQQPKQAGNISMTGRVRTAQEIVVPGAAVRVLHVSSGKHWETSTDEEGNFFLRDLPPGQYRIEAHQLGLGNAVLEKEIIPNSTQVPAVSTQVELTLSVNNLGGVSGTDDKASIASKVATASGTKGTSKSKVNRDRVASETASSPAANSVAHAGPVKKHHKSKKDGFDQVETSGMLTANSDPVPEPAARSTPSTDTNTQVAGAESYLISGAIGRSSTANIGDANGQDDSVSSDDSSGKKSHKHHSGKSHSGTMKALPQPDASDNLSDGLADLAVRDKIKHLGSNQVHLTLYNYYDTSKWDARNYALTGIPSPMIAHFTERFGLNLGGPLVIPKLYKGTDRTFWFVNYELNRRTNAIDLFENVPTAAERQGNFCDRGIHLFDPLTNLSGPRQPFGCTLPASRLNPVGLKLVDLIPLPNLSGFVQNYHRQARVPASMDIVNLRALHSLSPRLSILGIYNLVEAGTKPVTNFPSLEGNSATRAQNVTITLTQNWTPRLVNETKVNFNRNRDQVFSTNAFTNDIAAQYGFTGVPIAPIDFGIPLIRFANLTTLADPAALLVRNQTLRFSDNVSYTLRRHTIRAGTEIRRRQLNTYTDPLARGAYSFSGLMTSQLDASGKSNAATGFDFADLLLGLPEATTVKVNSGSNYGRSWQFISYVQDDWRITPRFSMNYGVRYEFYTPFVEKNNHLANLLVNFGTTQVAAVVPGQGDPFGGSLPNSLIRAKPANFAPRVGIAWRPLTHGGPVIRAGYGIFYVGSIYDRLYSSMLNQPPWSYSRMLVTSPSQLLTLENGFPTSSPDAVNNIYGVDPNYKVGYAQIWNFSMEQQFGKSYVMELLYTGTKGTHLDVLEAPNQATPGSVVGSDQRRRIPNAGDFTYETSAANSIYDGVQLRLQKRMSNGIRFQFLYTLSHSIDNASLIGVGSIPIVAENYNNLRAERGNSSFDIRHDIRTTFFYDLPFGGRRRWLRSGIGAKLFGNWQLSTTTMMNSGNHLTPYITAKNTNGTGSLFSQRPNQIGNPNLPSDERTNSRFFNIAAFSLPPAGAFGNAARGSIVGPAFFNVNASFGRRMHFGKEGRYQFELRWEVQNLTNAANFSNVVTVVDATDAGVITGTKSMRSMDLMLRLRF